MKLTASPFDSATGTLLPVYRDAYLRGDLTRQNTEAVDAYLKTNRQLGDEALMRFYYLKQEDGSVKATGWVGRQLDAIRTQPQRFRQRATALVAGAALIAGASMAAVNLPTNNLPTDMPGAATPTELAAADASVASMRMVTVRGRILNENGQPIAGATVINKNLGRGVGTDANGNYTLVLPASQAKQLQFAYAGYEEENIDLQGRYTHNVTLLPTGKVAKKSRRWLFF